MTAALPVRNYRLYSLTTGAAAAGAHAITHARGSTFEGDAAMSDPNYILGENQRRLPEGLRDRPAGAVVGGERAAVGHPLLHPSLLAFERAEIAKVFSCSEVRGA